MSARIAAILESTKLKNESFMSKSKPTEPTELTPLNSFFDEYVSLLIEGGGSVVSLPHRILSSDAEKIELLIREGYYTPDAHRLSHAVSVELVHTHNSHLVSRESAGKITDVIARAVSLEVLSQEIQRCLADSSDFSLVNNLRQAIGDRLKKIELSRTNRPFLVKKNTKGTNYKPSI